MPTEYVDVLVHDGGRFFRDQVLLYAAEDVIERNETFESKLYCPGYLAIGDDGGGTAFVIPMSDKGVPVYAVDQGSMGIMDFKRVGSNLKQWIEEQCPY